MKSYESRLKQKDKSIQDAIRICNLSPVGLGKGGTNASPTDDPVLLELNQLFPGN
jgi:argininosuccinate lyase